MKRKRQRRFHPLLDLNENQFRLKYRYTKENFRRIIEIVRDDLEIDYNKPPNRNQVPIDLQILSAIRLWGGTEHPQLTAMAHGVSVATMNKITRRVASVLSSKASRYIRMPATLSEKELVIRSFQSLANMPQVIGALEHASVRLRMDSRMIDFESSQSGSESPTEDIVHLQVICDSTHKIRDLDMRSSYELDLNTAKEMFSLSRIKERFEQNEFRGRILLGNDNDSNCNFLLTPVQYPRQQSEELYNLAHHTTFAPVQLAINKWFSRFAILGSELWASFGSAKQTITALALLHNMAVEWNDPSIDIETNTCLYRPLFLNYIPDCNYNTTSTEHRVRKEFIKSNFSCKNK
ncbi:putative nuclease HARBI1 [Scaptodrosophila lebanonensis]|uniref:Nuclease HARBI1 n=1 Tax=Drosophila lebanonensis TaxID=7225 RepID=A0A6J2T7N1_DROLE|nr:putative nuclease HARBI1 [Scaptodrosophila lebanonensis]